MYTSDGGLPSEAIQTIEDTLQGLSPELRQLSLDIWGVYSYVHAVEYQLDPRFLQRIQRLAVKRSMLQDLARGAMHTDSSSSYAHDRLTEFMASHGFSVTPHYLCLTTAWRAEFTHRVSGKHGTTQGQRSARVIGVNSEMDALPNVGHACGHNLIAMSGAAVAVAIKTALQKHGIPGTVVLLGTPDEETRGGKIILLERGAYEGMDACIM